MKKKVIKLTESDLHNIIEQSVRKTLKEVEYGNGSIYDTLTLDELAKIESYTDGIREIANSKEVDCSDIFPCLDSIDEFIENKKSELISV